MYAVFICLNVVVYETQPPAKETVTERRNGDYLDRFAELDFDGE